MLLEEIEEEPIVERTCRLSPGAMLYAVLRLRKSGIYGLLDVFSAIPDAQFPTCIQNAEQELLEKGYGVMDFDGNFSLEEDFARLVSGCADENCVLQIDRRKEGKQERMTCYLHQGATLTQAGTDCVLDAGAVLPDAVLDFLGLPEASEGLEETAVESRFIAERDVASLMEAGCGEALARLITASAAGEGGYAQLVRITDKVQTELLALAWSEAGTVAVEVEYPDNREVFRLTPVSAQAAGERIAAMAAL